MKRIQIPAILLGIGLVLVGCGADTTHVEGQEKKDMEQWLKHGIPASQSPGGGAKPTASSTPAGVPTDK